MERNYSIDQLHLKIYQLCLATLFWYPRTIYRETQQPRTQHLCVTLLKSIYRVYADFFFSISRFTRFFRLIFGLFSRFFSSIFTHFQGFSVWLNTCTQTPLLKISSHLSTLCAKSEKFYDPILRKAEDRQME